MIEYRANIETVSSDQLAGFFEGWPNAPSPEAHLDLLRNSDEVDVAIDTHSGNVIGFATALTDRVLSAYIPLLEVRPEFRDRGIGRELILKLLSRLEGLYMTDAICDPDVQPFYESVGFTRATGVSLRRYECQAGRSG